MKKKILTPLFALVFLLISVIVCSQSNTEWEKISNNRPEVYFRFLSNDKKEIKHLSRKISIDNIAKNWVHAYANEKEFEYFLSQDIDFQILEAPGLSIKNPKMIDVDAWRDMDDWDYYPTYEAYVDMMNQFETDYPSICKTVVLGTLPSGREIIAVRITDNLLSHENEPEFLYTATMHGDETVGYVLMLRLIDYFLSNYNIDQRITGMINNMEIWINPLANPDGTYAGGNNTVNGSTRANANGVDINRNFPDPEDGQHPDGNEWQPETVIFMDFAEDHDFVLSCNLHGGSEVCNYPWDTWYTRHADDDWWQLVCREYADTAQFYSPSGYMTDYNNGITNGYDWYTISGGRQDYMNYFHQCREFTLELSTVKLVPESQLPDFWDYNYRSFINYIDQTNFGVQGIVTDSITGEPIKAEVYVLEHDMDSSMVFSSLPKGNYYRPLYSGLYDIRFSADGYYSKTLQNVLVSNASATTRNVQLAPGTLIADFTSDNQMPGVGETINFYDNSYGYPVEWIWEFEGGEPAISYDENPVGISYADTGSFDVKLTIVKQDDSSTLIQSDFIRVDYHYLMGENQIITCSGLFYDSGENENYGNDEDFVTTFFPSDTQDNILAEFLMFEVEYDENCAFDWLTIYDGSTTTAPVIGEYCGTDSPGVVYANNAEGALTFEFHSDENQTAPGWIARISCVNNVGIKTFETTESIKIFPNPVDMDCLNISSDEIIQNIEIIDLKANVLKHIDANEKYISIALDDLKAGLYFIQIQTKNKIHCKKLIRH
jgi:PKD repeat protein